MAMSDFKDKVVFITGAGHGLGHALVSAFAAESAIVAANDMTDINLSEVVAKINAGGGQARIFDGDISKKLAMQTLVGEALEAYERIDILVNHASVQPHDPILEMDEWDWRRTVDVNLSGTFLVTQTVGRVMRELGGGVILNVGPVDGGEMEKPRAAYLASKSGVVAFTRAAAHELEPYNIRVNAILPSKAQMEASVEQALALCAGEDTGEVVVIE
jgi:NAD(P)-dependent dehydrogenase (short-subunit alcohol dehydrogenase family)